MAKYDSSTIGASNSFVRSISKSANLDLSITPPVNVDCSIPPFSNEELLAAIPSADELRIVIFVDTTLSIEPVKVLSIIILSEIVESSIVEFVRTTLFPVPSLKDESVIAMLLAVESVIAPLAKVEVIIVALVIAPFV